MENRTYRETIARQADLDKHAKDLEEQRKIREKRAEIERRQRAQIKSYLSQGEQNARRLDDEAHADERAEAEKKEKQRKEMEDDIENYNNGNYDAIHDNELRSEGQIKRANDINERMERERAKRNTGENLVNGLWDTALNAIPYVGQAKQALGVKIGGKIKKNHKNK